MMPRARTLRHCKLWICSTLLLFGSVLPAASDAVISGPVCVIDGNRIQIGGEYRDGSCWGGIDVILHGSVAPAADEKCHNKAGIEWPCGEAARKELQSIIRLATATCYHIDGEFDGAIPIATCLTGRKDISRELVRAGLARAEGHDSTRYERDAEEAKRRRLGLWK